MTALVVLACGPGTSIQDRGRFGFQRFGIGPAGAMDRVALAMANALVGNAAGAGGLEFALAGARLEVHGGPVRVALAGAAAALKVGGKVVPPLSSATAASGESIEIGPIRGGMFAYLAIAGGLAIAPDLGSLSLHVRAHLGGIDGRPLIPGDRLALRLDAPSGGDLVASAALSHEPGPIRVVLGPQDDYFTAGAIATLLSAPYTVTPQADRMGFRLAGPKLQHNVKGYNIVSDGIATGSIQVPGAGEPLILLADRQTAGGYPKIATVISADLPRLAQSPPGTVLHFTQVSVAAAIAVLRAQADALAAFRLGLRPPAAMDLASERLLGLNLVDGWVAGEM